MLRFRVVHWAVHTSRRFSAGSQSPLSHVMGPPLLYAGASLGCVILTIKAAKDITADFVNLINSPLENRKEETEVQRKVELSSSSGKGLTR